MGTMYEKTENEIILIENKSEMPCLIFRPSENDFKYTHASDGKLYEVISWSEDNEPRELDFLVEGSVKWDGCSHFWFTGSDEGDKDSYYHLCGVGSYLNFMRGLSFLYEIMIEKIGDKFLEKDEIVKLRELKLLEGYEVIKT